MKTYNSEEQKAVAADIFGRYPKANKVAVTSDGTGFIVDEGENAVKNHAKNNTYKKELSIAYFTRDEIDAVTPAKGASTAEALIAAISQAESAEAVEAIKASEEAGKKRASVINAAVAKLTELNAD